MAFTSSVGVDTILVNIRTGQMTCTKLQAHDRKNTASTSDIQYFIAIFHIFTKLMDAKLCRYRLASTSSDQTDTEYRQQQYRQQSLFL